MCSTRNAVDIAHVYTNLLLVLRYYSEQMKTERPQDGT